MSAETMSKEQISEFMRAGAVAACGAIPDGWGLVMICAQTNNVTYDGGQFISNLEKKSAIQLLRATADRLERNLIQTQ